MKYALIVTMFVTLWSNIGFVQKAKYSPAWFGPNANPVPEFTYARIPAKTVFASMAEYYFGYGDQTINARLSLEIPLLTEKVSVKVWTTPIEYYSVTAELADKRDMQNTSGVAVGDYYVQTRMRLLSEARKGLAIVLNATIKTTSGTDFEDRRYFNRAGYYFDFEFGKSINLNKPRLQSIRLAADLGFMSWDTSVNMQNDAGLCGLQVLLSGPRYNWLNSCSGYWGWMHTNPHYGSDYGDAPLVAATRFTYLFDRLSVFAQYQVGLINFPYHQIRLGTSIQLDRLTPIWHD